jgi:acetyl-CoA carboxylase carboxyltransferase component
MQTLADADSLLELKAAFGQSVLTAFARFAGRPVGLLASNPAHLGGAIDADAADKAAAFLRLCNARGLPVVSLIDTPGFMVGPAAEERAQVRASAGLFIAGARLATPLIAIVLRKAYGLGAMALAGGSLHAPLATAAWPTAEFGAMGLEGAVRLGFRKELDAAADDAARRSLFEQLLAAQIEKGKALNVATTLEFDAVIDPAASRDWIIAALQLRAQAAL